MPFHAIPAREPAGGQIAGQIELLRRDFPSAFREGKIDFEVLRQLLGGAVDDREERYGLNWHGKRAARQLALTPSAGTLRPDPAQSVDWDTTQNLMIEGENLEVLKLLQKPYAGKVKLIYIDPPYNTGKDFIYPDNFRDSIGNYLALTGQRGEGGEKLTTNPESSGRFHTDWLNMMYPRLFLARNLLRDDGAIFVSIDDHEAAHLRLLMDEIFGPENFVAELVWKNKYNAGALTTGFSNVHEYLVAYSRQPLADVTAPLSPEEAASYSGRDEKFAARGGYVTQPLATTSKDPRPNLRYPLLIGGREIWPERQWLWSRERAEQAVRNGEVVVNESDGKFSVRVKQYLRDETGVERRMKPLSILIGPYNQEGRKDAASLFGDDQVFPFPKPPKLLQHVLSLALGEACTEDDLVLDFFAGSGTTGHAVMAQNAADGGTRRYILVQLPEPTEREDYKTIADICRERLRRAGEKVRTENPMFHGDTGFRAFRLDSSNIRAWDPQPENVGAAVQESIEHLKADRSEEDILYELLLRLNLDLSLAIDQREIAGKAVFSAGAGTLFACLAPGIALAEVEPLALGIAAWRDELAPAAAATVVVRDSAFADDVAKANCAAILIQHGFAQENLKSL